jgi:hypothetical protein
MSDLTPVSKKTLPSDLEWLFPEYRFEELGLESYASVIIERVLEPGSWEQARWLFSTYGGARVTNWIRLHGFRLLSKRSFAFWQVRLPLPSKLVTASP